MLHVELVPGDQLKITVAPKGFGSENMSRIAMLKPSDGVEGVKAFVVDTVEQAGPQPLSPHRGGGGHRRHLRPVRPAGQEGPAAGPGSHHAKPFYAALEDELLDKINALGIGPQGFGGRTTALAVHIETLPTHIAGPALRGEHQLPRGPASDGGVVAWQGKSPPP